MHGFEAGFSRYSHFDEEHSLIAGLFFGAFARNFNYDIPGNEFTPPSNVNWNSNTAVSREFNFIGSIPILFEKRWFRTNQNFWNAEIGLTIRYTPSMEESEGAVDWNGDEFFNMDLTTNPSKKPWLNYNVGGGYNCILKNNCILKTSLVLNISFTSYVEGDYQFALPNQPEVEGHYETKGSFIISLLAMYLPGQIIKNKITESILSLHKLLHKILFVVALYFDDITSLAQCRNRDR